MPEMIKEDQYAEADPDGVGNLQDGKAGGTFSRNKSVKLAKKAAHIYVIIKGHNGKSGAEKGNQAYKKDFYIPEKLPLSGADAVGDDKNPFHRWEKYQWRVPASGSFSEDLRQTSHSVRAFLHPEQLQA